MSLFVVTDSIGYLLVGSSEEYRLLDTTSAENCVVFYFILAIFLYIVLINKTPLVWSYVLKIFSKKNQ